MKALTFAGCAGLGVVVFAGSAGAWSGALPSGGSRPPAVESTTAASGSETADPEFDRLAAEAEKTRAAARLDEAVRLYEKALERRPDWTEGRWSLGTILYSLERFEEARDAFRRVVAKTPEDGASWAFKGLCEFELREYDRALSDLQRAFVEGISNKEVYHVASYHLGILLTRYEQFEESLEQLARLARQGNESTSVIEALGLSVLRLPFLPSELPPEKREMVLMAGRATCHWANARRAPARMGFEELLLRYPEAHNIHYAYGVFLLKEDADAALAQFRRELQLSPYHVEAMLQIALEMNLRAEHEKALEFARKAVELAPQSAAARNILGRSLLNANDVEEAIKNLEQGVKLSPLSRQMRFELARAYARAGRMEDAAREREVFKKLDEAQRAAQAGEPPLSRIDLESKEEAPE
jgi:tetratricopeptide (TPR) repeat protein